MQKTIAILLPLILASLTPQAKADVIYDNLASYPTYSGQGGFPVWGANITNGITTGPLSESTRFVAGATGTLTDVLIPMWSFATGSAGEFNVTLTNSSNSVLESWTGLMASAPAASVVDAASALHPLLTSGDTYFVNASPNNAGTNDDWDSFNSLNVGHEGFRILGQVTPTPEPASLTLLGTSLLAFGAFRVRRWRPR